jgi:hypothetical protein
MRSSPLRTALVALLVIAVEPAAHAQGQNPFKAASEAIKKAMEDARRQAEGQMPAQPAQPVTGASQPATVAAQSGSPAAGSSNVLQSGDVPSAVASPQETARLAKALSYIDVAGVKLGSTLAEAQKVLAATNPAYRFTPQIETPWPLRGGQPPPNAPKSVLILRAEIIDANTSSSDSFELSAAVHPNPPVVIRIDRTMNFPANGGPSLDNLVAGLRKKYGPESAVDPNSVNDNNMRSFAGKWFFDERGQVLPGNLGSQVARTSCDMGYQQVKMGLCDTLTIVNVMAVASGAGVVNSLAVRTGSNPLATSAHETTQAYLRQVEQDLGRQQQQESSQRQVPKL